MKHPPDEKWICPKTAAARRRIPEALLVYHTGRRYGLQAAMLLKSGGSAKYRQPLRAGVSGEVSGRARRMPWPVSLAEVV
jgi:hypothetical protein